MIFLELTIAGIVGVLAGFTGERVVRRHRRVSRWLTTTVGAVAAISGTAAASSTRDEALGPVLTLGAPLFFAGIALAVAIARLKPLPAAGTTTTRASGGSDNRAW